MTRYLLDTNVVSQLLKEHPAIIKRLTQVPIHALCISSITEGELEYGLAKRPQAKRLHVLVRELLKRLDVLPWDSVTAQCYGRLRSELESEGKTLAPLDMLIAAHAKSANAVLVSNDKAFFQVKNLLIEDWTAT